MLDLWERLYPIFCDEQEAQTEIEITNLTPQALTKIIRYVFNHASGMQTEFAIREPLQRVMIPSVEDAVILLATGKVIGEIYLTLHFDQVRLPDLGIFFDGPDYMSIQYVMGPTWTTVNLTTLFEFLRMITYLEPGAKIGLLSDDLPLTLQTRFRMALQDYLNEKMA